MATQYQIPGGPFVNLPEDGVEYALPGYGQLNQATTAGGTVVPVIVNHLRQQGIS
jgi:hypothetical protein